MNRLSPAQIEFQQYRNRPDLWALACALRHASRYKKAIWELLSEEDKEALRAHQKVHQAAVEALKD